MDGTAFEIYSAGGDSALIDAGYQKGDYTQVFLDRLRNLSDNMDVTDILLLEVALRLGSVDNDSKPRAKGGFTWAVEGRTLYRKPEQVSDSQLIEILQHIEVELESQKIAPASPIGAIAASSIGEPIYQAVMRTFHYAGVLTANVDPLDVLNKQVSNIMDHETSSLIVALKPNIRFDRTAVFELARSLGRSQFGNYARIIKYDPIYQEALVNNKIKDIEKEIEDLSRQGDSQKFVLLDEQDPIVISRRERLGMDFDPLDDYFSNEYTPEYKRLLDKKKIVRDNYLDAILESSRGSSFLIYLKTDQEVEDSVTKDGESKVQILEPGDLWKIVRRQLKWDDGTFRQIQAFPNLFNNTTMTATEITVEGFVRPAIILKFPYLTSRLDLGLQTTIPRLEFCNGCRGPVTIAKLVNKNKKKVTEFVDDPEWDAQSPIDSYTMEIVEQTLRESGLKTNPDSAITDTTGLIEVDMSEAQSYDFEIAELGRNFRRCGKCKKGWYNVAVLPLKIDTENTERIYDPQKPKLGHHAVMFENEVKSSAGSDYISPSAGDMPTTVYSDLTRYPGFSQPGQNHDYPLHTMHSGNLPNDPLPNEWFLQIILDNPNDGRNDTFQGHLATVQASDGAEGADFADFNRSNSNNLRDVERVLGIEAARFCLAHNLARGQDSDVNYKHYMLLADTMTNGVSIKTASKGSSSISGAASEKGNRSIIRRFPRDATDEVIREALATNGINAPVGSQNELLRESAMLMLDIYSAENYGSVLAQAYERQVEVVMRRAVQGMADTLEAPNSAQIAGVPVRMGTYSNATKGKYAPPNMNAVINVIDEYLTKKEIISLNRLETMLQGRVPTKLFFLFKGEITKLKESMDTFCKEYCGHYWWPFEGLDSIGDFDQVSRSLIPQSRMPNPIIGLQMSQSVRTKLEFHTQLMADEEFFGMFNRVDVLEKSLAIIRQVCGLSQ
jgi:hypothetical protein